MMTFAQLETFNKQLIGLLTTSTTEDDPLELVTTRKRGREREREGGRGREGGGGISLSQVEGKLGSYYIK